MQNASTEDAAEFTPAVERLLHRRTVRIRNVRYSVLKELNVSFVGTTDNEIAGLQAEILEVLKLCIRANQEERYLFRSKLPCIDQDVHLGFCIASAYESQLDKRSYVFQWSEPLSGRAPR